MDEALEDFELQDLLDAMPYYAMVLDEQYNVLMANCNYTAETGCAAGPGSARCFEAVHGLQRPVEGCPLADAVLSQVGVERDIYDKATGWMHVSVHPFARPSSHGGRLYLHVVRPKM